MSVYVNATTALQDHVAAADASSALVVADLGHAERHARTTTGIASLPHNAAVEVEPVAVARQAQEGAEVE